MMAQLPPKPEDSKTVQAIYAWHESRREDKPRTYLGASQIGAECERSLWYSFRHCGGEDFSGRMLRLFETGDLAEFRFVDELRGIGCEVYDVDPNTGEQFAVKAHGGHVRGHLDGCAKGLPEAPETFHVTEYKTHSAKSFAHLKNHGVKKSKPQHYAQMAVYMKLTGMKRALYLAANKDTDELYSERLRWEEGVAEDADRLMERAKRIIEATAPPSRISDAADSFACKWCSYKNLCHGLGEGGAVPCSSGCRTCVHATPEMDGDGRWSCNQTGSKVQITIDKQAVGCGEHKFIPGLVTFAEPVDSSKDWIEYRNADDTTWRNGPGEYSSDELTKLPDPMVGAGLVGEVKEILGGEVVDVREEVQD
jgi:CRISPR/Cas system-associated exonuclease Cas4 (RecB family)